MDIKDYKAGKWIKQIQYKSFSPSPINHVWTWSDPTINILLEKAMKALGELNAYSVILPDADTFIRMHIVKESTTSSRIEGTQTNMEEALQKEESITPNKRDDWREVQNYITAINQAIEELDRLPLSSRLIKETHKILLNSARGKEKSPGVYRTSQNWIGGSSLSDAMFIPPHYTELTDLISDLEKFIHHENETPILIKAAILHYQFETIHPFLDGNGRIGRLIIPLYLISTDTMKKPTLYLSDFFERHRASYFDALMKVRTDSDIAHWIKFFLNAVIDTATIGRETFSKIQLLREELNRKIIGLGKRAMTADKLINHLYRSPFINLSETVEVLGVSKQAANGLLNAFLELEILHTVGTGSRNRQYYFRSYLELFSPTNLTKQ